MALYMYRSAHCSGFVIYQHRPPKCNHFGILSTPFFVVFTLQFTTNIENHVNFLKYYFVFQNLWTIVRDFQSFRELEPKIFAKQKLVPKVGMG